MKRLLTLILLIGPPITALHAQAPSLPDVAHFTINQGNHPVGRSDFSIQAIKQGQIATPSTYAVSSHGTLTLPKTTYSFSGSGSLDKELGIVSEDLNGIVNGSAVTFAVRPAAANFAIDISANGRSYRNSISRPAQTVFFPDFDLSSYEILLNLAARHPGLPISALIPKQTGILSTATLAQQADAEATLNKTAITVHHSSLTIGSVVSELYYSRDNRILEVDIPSQTFALVRDGFQLQQPPPPPPEAAQSGQPPAASPQAQPQ